jgi:hypothetical protein
MSLTFTVFFENRFWVGLFTLTSANAEKYARLVFEKEPSNTELYEFVLYNFYQLQFTDYYRIEGGTTPVKNPKRRQREISKELKNSYHSKKSYEAIKLSLQQSNKKKKREEKKAQEEERDKYLFHLKQLKHKGH